MSAIARNAAVFVPKLMLNVVQGSLKNPKATALAAAILASNSLYYGADALVLSFPCMVACMAAAAGCPLMIAACYPFCAVLP